MPAHPFAHLLRRAVAPSAPMSPAGMAPAVDRTPVDVLLRRMGIAPPVAVPARPPQLVTAQFKLRTPRSTPFGSTEEVTETMRIARLVCKSVQLVFSGLGANVTLVIEGSIADDANNSPLWSPIVTGIQAPGFFPIQVNSVEICPRSIRVRASGNQVPGLLPANLQAFFSGLWNGEGPYCNNVSPYNLGG